MKRKLDDYLDYDDDFGISFPAEVVAPKKKKKKKIPLTEGRLKELVHYDPHGGLFTVLTQSPATGNRPPGSPLGGYSRKTRINTLLYTTIDGRRYFLHRLAFYYMTGEMPQRVRHLNRIKTDNRWRNLEVAAPYQYKNLPVIAEWGEHRLLCRKCGHRWDQHFNGRRHWLRCPACERVLHLREISIEKQRQP